MNSETTPAEETAPRYVSVELSANLVNEAREAGVNVEAVCRTAIVSRTWRCIRFVEDSTGTLRRLSHNHSKDSTGTSKDSTGIPLLSNYRDISNLQKLSRGLYRQILVQLFK